MLLLRVGTGCSPTADRCLWRSHTHMYIQSYFMCTVNSRLARVYHAQYPPLSQDSSNCQYSAGPTQLGNIPSYKLFSVIGSHF